MLYRHERPARPVCGDRQGREPGQGSAEAPRFHPQAAIRNQTGPSPEKGSGQNQEKRIGGMKMNAQECLHILREIKDVSFATVDEKGFPQVRIIDVMLIENNKLYFCSARGKDFYKQLKINNHVALCAMTKNYQMIRYSGKAQRLDNQKYWIDRIFKENP